MSDAKSVTTLPPGAGRALTVSTPRLRQDFPETLVWKPSLVTGADGRAFLRFDAADTITTWRMAVIGSTEDGLIGTVTADLRAFLPFFIEHKPPRSLTVGDEIEAAVVVRNYQPRPSDVMVRLEPTPWMHMLDEQIKRVQIDAGDSAAARLTFKAILAGKFKQEASAKGSDGDRVAVPVQVRFDGRDMWSTYADLFQRETTFDVEIPQDAIPGSTEIELKVYPDLFAHLVEAIQGIVQRPGGCLEQTASAGFANLIALQYLKRSGLRMPELERRALGNLSQAIARARSFTSGGGYSYFSGEQPDAAVTAYVMRLMIEAGEFLTVDEYAIESARRFLEREQMEDGSWEPRVSIAVLRS
ncbi:MAG TPA: alpha-2-macroglobulin family protein, partial [Blastocatellia bacterium]|nr:alpha-2-macroglobulin family protein [Blastocatellia bacterium]